jgi:hypothetical protein
LTPFLFEAEIFSDPDCYLYLLYIIEKKPMLFKQGMTVYAYLMALMQFTNKQPLREEDKDVKFEREMSIDVIAHDNELTAQGKIYLEATCKRLAEIHVNVDYQQLTEFVLSLPPSEQWLIKVKFEDVKSNDCDLLAWILLKNISFIHYVGTSGEKTGWIPSFTLIDYLINKVSSDPMQAQFIFGTVNKNTLRTLHSQEQHPVSLYATGIKSNPRHADGYRCGPFLMWLHDIGHLFWASMLGKKSREIIFYQYIPQVESLMKEANEFKDEEAVAKIQTIIDRASDYDLTDIRTYTDPSKRLETYLSRTFGLGLSRAYGRGGLYPYSKVEFDEIGSCVEDRIFFLIYKLYNNSHMTKNEKNIWESILPHLQGGTFKRDDRVIDALRALTANNKSLSRPAYGEKINWKGWLEILESTTDSKTLWDKIVASLDYELLTLIIYYNLKFFHPYLPMTPEKLKEFKKFAQEEALQPDVKKSYRPSYSYISS